MRRSSRSLPGRWIGLAPFVVVGIGWLLLPRFIEYPAYMLPSPDQVLERLQLTMVDGSLVKNLSASLVRLVAGFAAGCMLALVVGIAIAMNRHVAETLMPVLTFMQSIAGIAWVPLAIIWFGIGSGAVIFVVANTIFFSLLHNAVVGVQQIPNVLHRAVRSHGASGRQILTSLILPGALVQITLGMRTAMAYGWRALVAGEMIGGTSGIGYMTIEAVQFFQTDTVLLGMIIIGVLWLVMDKVIFATLERNTVVRWGLLQR
jgi:ABC-type nitrate/sulfonate/bicarbonate transport system permease component